VDESQFYQNQQDPKGQFVILLKMVDNSFQAMQDGWDMEYKHHCIQEKACFLQNRVRAIKGLSIDISIWLHPIVQSVDVALTLHMEPKYPMDDLLAEIDHHQSLLVSAVF
jgi:hypothetical protein